MPVHFTDHQWKSKFESLLGEKNCRVKGSHLLYVIWVKRGKRVITSFGISWRGIHEVLCPSQSVPKLTYASCMFFACSIRILSSVKKETSPISEMPDVECRFSSHRFPIILPVREISRRWSGLGWIWLAELASRSSAKGRDWSDAQIRCLHTIRSIVTFGALEKWWKDQRSWKDPAAQVKRRPIGRI